MFKYTAKKEVLRAMQVKKADRGYFARMAVLKEHGASQNYVMQSALEAHYPGTVFYSKTPVKYVPVNGLLFPVSMFEVALLKD
jgi:hypothetical protein